MLVASYSFSQMKQVVADLELMVPYYITATVTYCGYLVVFDFDTENPSGVGEIHEGELFVITGPSKIEGSNLISVPILGVTKPVLGLMLIEPLNDVDVESDKAYGISFHKVTDDNNHNT